MKHPFVPRSTSRRFKTAVTTKLANHCDIDYVIYSASGNALRIHDVVQNYFPPRRRASKSYAQVSPEQPLSRILELQSRLTGQSVVNIQQTLGLRI
ncbi:unnamed protein product [Lasius platythorax]|uniref:Uncharacterized protein n=1 Tax=Lasius platythorax TaxID=488582 RepID=A0AAV2N5U6_9HYME